MEQTFLIDGCTGLFSSTSPSLDGVVILTRLMEEMLVLATLAASSSIEWRPLSCDCSDSDASDEWKTLLRHHHRGVVSILPAETTTKEKSNGFHLAPVSWRPFLGKYSSTQFQEATEVETCTWRPRGAGRVDADQRDAARDVTGVAWQTP